jgi:ubiquinol-cytochrome c reductase iron-sulfur subunit
MSGESSPELTPEQMEQMSREELMLAGAEADGVHILHRRDRFPVPGTRLEKRAERQVAALLGIATLGALAFMVCYVVVPWKFKLNDNNGYKWYTPVLGITLGAALLGLGFAAVLWAKKLMPEEEVAQDRHDDPANDFDRETIGASIVQGMVDTGLGRRKLLTRSVGLAGGAFGLMALFPVIGGLIKRPHGELDHTLWHKGVRLVQIDGTPLRPGDMDPGSLATVFPNVPNGTTDAYAPTMLIRLRPDEKITFRKGQSGFGWGDYIAFSKICTHLGCPVSLYEQQTNRILCPCHQSQFDVLRDCQPVFGPATRPLPQLPISVDSDGYFIARSDYIEPVGPAYWERKNP